MMTCLIIDDMHESIVSMLEKIEVKADYVPFITREEVLEQIHTYDILILRSKLKVNEELLRKAENLKFIGRAGAGLDQIDINAVANKGVQIVNAPEGNRDALAEQSLGVLLSLLNNVVRSDKQVRLFSWLREANRGEELANKTVGLLGYGFMAKAFAKRLKAIGCNVIAYDKYKTNFSDEYVREVGMEEIYRSADIFSIHVPLTEETKGLVDAHYISKFQKEIWIINTSRGKTLVLKGLIEQIEKGKVKGAGLDVVENEKFDSLTANEKEVLEDLFCRDNVILTPHVAGWSFESYYKINEVLVEKLQSLIRIH